MITSVATIGIPVADPERAVAFYVGTLGFEKRRDLPFGEGRWIEVAPPGAATTIALVPTGVAEGIRLTTPDAGAARDALTERGVDADPGVMRIEGVPPMFAIRDPDGNGLVILEIDQ